MEKLSRRRFMQTAGALAAAGAIAPRLASANDRINVGIIGCRNRGPQVAESMSKSGQFNIVTICDCDDAMRAKALSDNRTIFEKAPPKEARDFRALLDDKEIDAVVVATPDHWHALMCVMALDAGKHVYAEKPASYNIDDGKAMVRAQEKHGNLVVQVGTQQRSGEHFKDAKAFIAGGGLGKVGFCRASHLSDRQIVPIIPNGDPPAGLDFDMWIGPAPMRPYNEALLHYNWHFLYDYGTGDMGNWGAHWLDVLRWLVDLDLPTSVSGYGGPDMVQDAKEWPDTQTVTYSFPGCTMLWELRHWSKFMPGGGEGNCCEIAGEKGAILIDRKGWTFTPSEDGGKSERHGSSSLEVPHAESFANAIRGAGAPSAPIVEGHKSAILCHLGNIAARLNRSVNFDPGKQVIVGDPEAEAMMGRPYRDSWRMPDA